MRYAIADAKQYERDESRDTHLKSVYSCLNRWPFNLGLAALTVLCGIFFYLSCWLPWVRGMRTSDYNRTHPDQIKVASACAVGSWLL